MIQRFSFSRQAYTHTHTQSYNTGRKQFTYLWKSALVCRRNPYFRRSLQWFCALCVRLLGSLWQYKPFSGRYVTDSNVDMLRHVRKGRLGAEPAANSTVEANAAQYQASRDTHTYMQLDWGEPEGIMREKPRRLLEETLPCQSLDRRDSPSAAEGSDYIFPLEHRMVQSRIQQCRSHINYMVIRSREPVRHWSALNRGRRWAVKETAPTPQPPPLSNFQEVIFGIFLKPADLKFQWQKHHFRTWILSETFWKMEYIFIWSSQQKPSSSCSLTAAPIAVLV